MQPANPTDVHMGQARTFLMAFEGESIRIIDQCVDHKLVIVLEVYTVVQMTLETCYL